MFGDPPWELNYNNTYFLFQGDQQEFWYFSSVLSDALFDLNDILWVGKDIDRLLENAPTALSRT